jgi:hypothetical protein
MTSCRSGASQKRSTREGPLISDERSTRALRHWGETFSGLVLKRIPSDGQSDFLSGGIAKNPSAGLGDKGPGVRSHILKWEAAFCRPAGPPLDTHHFAYKRS